MTWVSLNTARCRPSGLSASSGRSVGYFYPLPNTAPNTSGSAVPIGKMWLVDPADATKQVALIDASAAMDDVNAAGRDATAAATTEARAGASSQRPRSASIARDRSPLA